MTPYNTFSLLRITYSSLVYSSLIYSPLLSSTLFYSPLLYSPLLYSTLLGYIFTEPPPGRRAGRRAARTNSKQSSCAPCSFAGRRLQRPAISISISISISYSTLLTSAFSCARAVDPVFWSNGRLGWLFGLILSCQWGNCRLAGWLLGLVPKSNQISWVQCFFLMMKIMIIKQLGICMLLLLLFSTTERAF